MKAAVYTSTYHLYPDIEPSMKALMHNSDVDKIYLVIEDDDVGFKLPDICEIVKVKVSDYFSPSGPNWNSPWTYMVLIRSVYYKLFPEVDRILSIDADAFVLKDISSLWDLDMKHYLLAGVNETSELSRPELPYYNAGVMMQNLDLLRKSGRGDEIVRTLQNRKWKYPEQDAFNAVCSGAILSLPSEYNAGRGTEPYGDPVIRHFMGEQATYRDSDIYKHFKKMPWSKVRP